MHNAAKYTPSGGHVTLRFELEPEEVVFKVVDDNPDATEALAALLEVDGHRVATAADGRQALLVKPVDLEALSLLLGSGAPGRTGRESSPC